MATNQKDLIDHIKSSLYFLWEGYLDNKPFAFEAYNYSKKWWQFWKSTEAEWKAEWEKITRGKLAVIAYRCRRDGYEILETTKKLPQNNRVKKLFHLAEEVFYIASVEKSDNPLSYVPAKNKKDMEEIMERLKSIRAKVKKNVPLMEAIVKEL